MKFTFDLFNGDESPSNDFVGWVPKWWYRSKGLPIEKGVLPSGDEWLLVGWVISEGKIPDIVERFRSTSIESLYESDGEFILLICSKSDNAVEIYRDRTGILPLVYAQGPNGVALSLWLNNVSELTGISVSPSRSLLEVWPLYRVTIPPHTVVEEVRGLSGNCSLRILGKDIFVREHPMRIPEGERYRSLDGASIDLGATLSQAVKKRIYNCQNLGAWLSGGNDSSLLVALAREHYKRKIKTVFVTFEGYQRNYGKYASEVAEQFETDHAELFVTLRNYLNLWAHTIQVIQAPINHPGTIGQTAALRHLGGGVDVMLSGLAADTVFGGPYWAPMLLLSSAGKYLPSVMRKFFRQIARRVEGERYFLKGISKCLRALGTPLNEYVHSENGFGNEESIDRVFGSETWQKTINGLQQLIKDDPLTDLFCFHLLDWNPATVAVELRLGFDSGLACFFPFLDYELIQNSLRLPTNLRYHYRTKKAALKNYNKNFFSQGFIYKQKEGFGVPLAKWFTKPEFEPFLSLPLEGRSLRRGWWEENELRKMIEDHKSGWSTDKSAESIPWITTNLELWARICLEGDSPELYKI